MTIHIPLSALWAAGVPLGIIAVIVLAWFVWLGVIFWRGIGTGFWR